MQVIDGHYSKITTAYKDLCAESPVYPLLGWTQIRNWIEKKLDLFDDLFTVELFKGIYKSVKQI
jgi:hypothetical protein